MFALLTISIVGVLVGHGFAQQHYGVKQELITHANLHKELCSSSAHCKGHEVCEQVCFTEKLTQHFIGCKTVCVQRSQHNFYKGPIAQPRPTPTQYTKPKYVPPKAQPKYVPRQPQPYAKPQPHPIPVVVHPREYQTHYKCSYNQHCGTHGYCNAGRCVCHEGYNVKTYQPFNCHDSSTVVVVNDKVAYVATTIQQYYTTPPPHPVPIVIHPGIPPKTVIKRKTCKHIGECGKYAYCEYNECKCQVGYSPIGSPDHRYDCERPRVSYDTTPKRPAPVYSGPRPCYTDHDCDYALPKCCLTGYNQRPYSKTCQQRCY